MMEDDLAMRRRFDTEGVWDDELDNKNTALLKTLIATHGWPTIPMVGKKASRGAWLITQHADHDVSFQKKAIGLIKEALVVDPKCIDGANLAYLIDRTRLSEGKKQIYGTQFKVTKSGRLKLLPVFNIKKLNILRAAYDLCPIEEILAVADKHKQAKAEPSPKKC